MDEKHINQLKDYYYNISSKERIAILKREEKTFSRAHNLMLNARSKQRKEILKKYLQISFEDIDIMNEISLNKLFEKTLKF